MAPRVLSKYFPKLPKEVQLEIFDLACGPRIIRATWESVVAGNEYKAIYTLFGGPVPQMLHISRETRAEALKRYTLVRSQASLAENAEKRLPQKSEYGIYINFDIDTLYFLNFPDTNSFLSWMRRVPREPKQPVNLSFTGKEVTKIVEKKEKLLKAVKHIAFSNQMPLAWSRFENKLDVWFAMVLDTPGLETIGIVFDSSSFKSHKYPPAFSFKEVPEETWKKYPTKETVEVKPDISAHPSTPFNSGKPATQAKPVRPSVPSRPAVLAIQSGPSTSSKQFRPAMPAMSSMTPTQSSPLIPSNPSMPSNPSKPAKPTIPATPNHLLVGAPPTKPEGRWLVVPWRGYLAGIVDNFFDKSDTMGTTAGAKFREWKLTDEGKKWVAPTFMLLSISMDPKKKTVSGDYINSKKSVVRAG